MPLQRSGKLYLGMVCCAISFNALAYRTDHGMLPAGSDVCALHPPVTLDIPANAAPIPDPQTGGFSHGFYHVEEIDSDLYYITDGTYQAMFLISDIGIILVDAPPSIGLNQQDSSQSVTLVDAIYSIPETQGIPIHTMIYSHAHVDHIAAASIVKDAFPDVNIVAHHLTREEIERGEGENEGLLPGSGALPPPLPTQVFHRNRRLTLGDQTLILSYHGAAHLPGNIFIHAPQQKVLMLVDVMFPGWSPFTNLALTTSVTEYIESYDEVLAYDFDTFIGGHFNRLGTRQDIIDGQQYIADIKANAFQSLQNPDLLEIFSVVSNNGLAAFAIYIDQVACDCAITTLDAAQTPSGIDWRTQLGNADISTLTHCWEIAEALRIEASF